MKRIMATHEIVPGVGAAGVSLYDSLDDIHLIDAKIESSELADGVTVKLATFAVGVTLQCLEERVARISLTKPYKGSWLGHVRPGVDLSVLEELKGRLTYTDNDLLTIDSTRGVWLIPEGETTFAAADDLSVGEIIVLDESADSLWSLVFREAAARAQVLTGKIARPDYEEAMGRSWKVRVANGWLSRGSNFDRFIGLQ